MDTVWKTNGVKRVDCCPYCTLAFCSVISISTQGLITPLHYTMSGAPGSRLRHAPFDWLRLGFSAQPHPKGFAGKQEEGQPLEPETAHIIPDSRSNPPQPTPTSPVAIRGPDSAGCTVCMSADEIDSSYMEKSLISFCINFSSFCPVWVNFQIQLCSWRVEVSPVREAGQDIFTSCLQGQKHLFIE